MEITIGRKGEQSFPITDKGVSSKHAKLTMQPDGSVLVEDLGSTNGTFINGVRIIKKVVSKNTVVQLGKSYTFRIADVWGEAKSNPIQQPQPAPSPKPQTPEYSITRLERVWQQYDAAIKELNDKSKSIGLMSRVSPIFTLGSGAIAGIARGNNWGDGIFTITTFLSILGLIIMIYSICQTKSFDYQREKEKLDDEFIQNYTCPNPECKHFMGFQRYSILRQNKNCPYCRCKHLS